MRGEDVSRRPRAGCVVRRPLKEGQGWTKWEHAAGRSEGHDKRQETEQAGAKKSRVRGLHGCVL